MYNGRFTGIQAVIQALIQAVNRVYIQMMYTDTDIQAVAAPGRLQGACEPARMVSSLIPLPHTCHDGLTAVWTV